MCTMGWTGVHLDPLATPACIELFERGEGGLDARDRCTSVQHLLSIETIDRILYTEHSPLKYIDSCGAIIRC